MGGFQDRQVHIQDSLFREDQDRGAAKFKVSFFCPPFYYQSVAVIMDFPYQEGTHFHLNQKTEMFGVNDRVLSGIFQEDRAGFQGGGPYGVEKAGDGYLFDCQAAVGITVAVVVVWSQTENKAEAVFVPIRQFRVTEKLFQGIVDVLDMEPAFSGNGMYT